ncbi:MAG: hypothetical protein Q9183_004100, partial [Haloplaca sp. 2 TL-2023]
MNPLTHPLQEKELLELWAVDLVKVVGKFGVQLVKYPKAIQTLVPALSPSSAVIHQQFGRTKAVESMTVSGFSSQRWDDCLSKFSVGRDCQPLRIVCMDRYFAILTSDGTLRLYDAVTHQLSRQMVHGERVLCFRFSSSHEQCVTYGFRTTKVWDVESGRPIHSIANPTNAKALDVAFSSNDSAVLSCSDDRLVRLWSFKSARATEPIDSGWQILDVNLKFSQGDDRQYNSPRRVVFNADSTQVAVAFRGFPLAVWDIPNEELLGLCERVSDKKNAKLDLHTDIGPICWNPVTGHVLGLYTDGCVFKWYPSPTESDSQELRTIATGIQCCPSGSLFATNNANGLLKVWDFHHFAIVYQLSCHYPIADLALSPDGRRIYDIRDPYCNIWEPNALIRLAEADEKVSETSSTAASSTQLSLASEAVSETLEPVTALTIGNRTISSYCLGNDVGLVRLHTPTSEGVVAQGFMPVDHIVWSDDETHLVTADLAGRLNVRSIDLSKKTPTCPSILDTKTGNGLVQILISPTSEHLLSATTTFVELWSVATKSLIARRSNISSPYSRWINHPADSSLLIQCTFFELRLFRWSQTELEPFSIFPIHKEFNQTLSEPNQAYTIRPTELSRLHSANYLSPDDKHHAVDQTFLSGNGLLLLQLSSPPSSGDRHRTVQYLSIDSNVLKASDSGDPIDPPDIQVEEPSSVISGATPATSNRPASSLASNNQSKITAVELPYSATTNVQKVLGFVTASPRRKSHGVISEADVVADVLVFVDHDDWVCSMTLGNESRTNVDVKRHFFLPQDWLNLESLRLAKVSRDGTLYYPRNGEVAVVAVIASSNLMALQRDSNGTGQIAQPSRGPDDDEKQLQAENSDIPYTIFTKPAKRWIVFLVALAGFFSPLSANIYFPALDYLGRDLHVSLELINLTITAYLVCQGIVPSIVGDTADMIGRRPVYIVSFIVYLAANIGLALQDSYPALLVLRVLQSAGSS